MPCHLAAGRLSKASFISRRGDGVRFADRGGGHAARSRCPRGGTVSVRRRACPSDARRGPGRTRGRYVHGVQEYYDELWESLPEDLAPPDYAVRRRFALANVARGERVLDLGCGVGDLAADMAGAGARVTAADVAQAALDRARRRHPELDLRLIALDGPLPFADGDFDVVWSSEVIEHVADTARWLSEVRRVLAPGGRVLLTTPATAGCGCWPAGSSATPSRWAITCTSTRRVPCASCCAISASGRSRSGPPPGRRWRAGSSWRARCADVRVVSTPPMRCALPLGEPSADEYEAPAHGRVRGRAARRGPKRCSSPALRLRLDLRGRAARSAPGPSR